MFRLHATTPLTCVPLLPPAANVNDPPVVPPQYYTVREDQVLYINASNGLLKGTSDPDPMDVLEVYNTTQPPNGNVTAARNGSFVYTPNTVVAPWLVPNGQDSFKFMVTDNAGARNSYTSNMAYITIGELGCLSTTST